MSYYDRDKANAQPSMMWPKPHFGSAVEYQVSGWPFVANVGTGETDFEVDFGSVTRWITVHALGASCDLMFKAGGEAFKVPVGELVRLELKCTKIYITTSTGTCSIIAGVTSIDDEAFPDISSRAGI